MADEAVSMTGKTVLITGGTSGIGKATAVGLAALGARVAITGRDLTRVAATAVEISGATGSPDVDAFGADLSSQIEVRRLATDVLDAYPRLDVLINNVGGFWATRHITADGLEHTFAVNHLAGFLLTNLLLDRLKSSSPARVVTVSSGAQSMGEIDFENLQGEGTYSGQTSYSQSKLANVMFTYELARRLEGTGVTANVLHPGVTRTAFGAEDPSWISKVITPALETVHEHTSARRSDIDLPGFIARGGDRQRSGTSPRGNRRPPARRRMTRTRRPACGRSAHTSSAWPPSRQAGRTTHPYRSARRPSTTADDRRVENHREAMTRARTHGSR